MAPECSSPAEFRRTSPVWLCCLLWLGIVPHGRCHELQRLASNAEQFRGPVAMAALNDSTAVVANARSGSLSLLDVDRAEVIAEFSLGGSPVALALHQGQLLVADASRPRLVALALDREGARVAWELPLPAEPNRLQISSDGERCTVGLPWARLVAVVRLPAAGLPSSHAHIEATVHLPFAPGEQLHLPGQSVFVVADAFGGRLAAVSLERHAPIAVHEFPAHNIRGLHADGTRLLVSHQILNSLAPPRPSDIVWGGMVSNGLRWLRLENVLDPDADVLQGSKYIQLGDGSQGAGDPASFALSDGGRIVLALAGVNEVAVVRRQGYGMDRLAVGSRPVALLRWTAERFLVANELSCSVSLIDIDEHVDIGERESSDVVPTQRGVYGGEFAYGEAGGRVRTIRLGKRPNEGAAERGERLFFSARLSRGNWFSCHSCHTDGHSNGRLADTFGDGSEGAAKRVLSLLGVSETGPFAWAGDRISLRDQVHDSVRSTMQGKPLTATQADDLVAFLKTLQPAPAFRPANSPAEHAEIAKGAHLFASLGCQDCHADSTLTSSDTYDVGVWDELDNRRFNPPSLRGVGHRHGLFHDMRAANVKEVIARFRHQLTEPLAASDQAALIRYLESL